MAGKEATLVLLDVGKSMQQQYEGSKNKMKRLDISIDCINLMLENKLFNFKNHEVGLILFGAADAPDGNTIYAIDISKPNFEFIRSVSRLRNHKNFDV